MSKTRTDEQKATYPRSQHWTVQGFRISVLLYQRSTERCATCGAFPARHYVGADGQKEREGFRGNAHFCDLHRPERGTLPPLVYERCIQSLYGSIGDQTVHDICHEAIDPYGACAECDAPAHLRYEIQCRGCDGQVYSTQRLIVTGGVTDWAPREFHHTPHSTATVLRCREHPLEGP